MKESRDILTLFEALSNHEVFTPPRVVRDLLDLLPIEIWTDPSVRFLDPCTKSGVFLREAFFRFFSGLPNNKYKTHDGQVYDLSERQQRINHILKNMLYGIAISELTSYMSRRTLYGVMKANIDKQIASIESFEQSRNFEEWDEDSKYDFIGRHEFNEYFNHKLFSTPEYVGFEEEGNVFYPVDEVQRKVIEDGSFELEETYYPFIEKDIQHQKIKDIRKGKVKFDVIIGNPPYQVSTSTKSRQAKPVYHEFVEQAISLEPKFIVMITPSRWFSGGMGLAKFRNSMMSDRRLAKLVDFPNSKDCFPGLSISGGVNYFLWERNHKGPCLFTTHHNGQKRSSERVLDEYKVVVRFDEARQIINKVKKTGEDVLASHVCPINVYDLASSVRGESTNRGGMLSVIHSDGVGYIYTAEVKDVPSLNGLYKVVVSRTIAEHANEPARDGTYKVLSRVFILGPEEVCTHSYLVVAAFVTVEEAEACEKFLQTRLARFLILQTVSGIDLSSERFMFVPYFDYRKVNTDEELYEKYGLSDQDVTYIENVIKPWEL